LKEYINFQTLVEKGRVININNETAGIATEYEWLRNHFPGYQNLGQSLVNEKNKPYDVLKIKTSEGKILSVYFDISKFYGKF